MKRSNHLLEDHSRFMRLSEKEALRSLDFGGREDFILTIGSSEEMQKLESDSLSMKSSKEKDGKSYVGTFCMILAWYAANIGTLLLNKLLLSNFQFKYPFFLTACHMLASTLMTALCIMLKVVPAQPIHSNSQYSKIFLLAAIFGGSIYLGNASLRFLPISFNQMVGATTPFFTALLAFIMLGTVERYEVYIALIPIVAGVMVSSGGEPQFHLIGLIVCLLSTAARALKSVLQSLLMSNTEEKLDSLNLLRYMAPIAFLLLIPSTLIFEETTEITKYFFPSTNEHFQKFIGLLFLNSMSAFFVNLLNFWVTKKTNALTLQVLGNAKGVFATAVSVAIFRNPLTLQSIIGYAITLAGVALYSTFKRKGN